MIWTRCVIRLLEWTGASVNSSHWKTQTRLIKADEAANDALQVFSPHISTNWIPWFTELFLNVQVKCLKTAVEYIYPHCLNVYVPRCHNSMTRAT